MAQGGTCRGRGCVCALSGGVVPPPTVHRCRWLAGAPKAQHSALPNQGQIQLQVWLLWGQFPPLVFGRTARAGPGRQRDSRLYEGKLKEVIKQLGIRKFFIFSPLLLILFSSCLTPCNALHPPTDTHLLGTWGWGPR